MFVTEDFFEISQVVDDFVITKSLLRPDDDPDSVSATIIITLPRRPPGLS